MTPTERKVVEVPAVMDRAADRVVASMHSVNDVALSRQLKEARAAVAEQQELLRRLVAWNRNPNGDGVELDALLASAESLVGYDEDADHPRHDYRQIPAVAELCDKAHFLAEMAAYAIEYLPEEAKSKRVPEFRSAIEDTWTALANVGGVQ